MLKFSCADYTFPLLSRTQTIQLLQLLDFEFVDIGLFERNCNFLPSALMASPRDFIRDVKKETQAAGLAVADVFLQIGLEPAESSANDPDTLVRARNREVFARALGFCDAMGCRHMTGLPGVAHGEEQRDFALAIEEATWRVDQCKRVGIVYAIEPHIGSICETTDSTRTLLAAVEGLTLTLDYSHFICLGEDSDAVHSLLPFASHVHLRGGSPGRLQTNVDENSIDFEGMIARLLKRQYDEKLALEYVWADWQDCKRTDNLSETILLRRRLQEVAAALK